MTTAIGSETFGNEWQVYLFLVLFSLVCVFGFCWHQRREIKRAMRVLDQQRLSRIAVQTALTARVAHLAQYQQHAHALAAARQEREFAGVCFFLYLFFFSVLMAARQDVHGVCMACFFIGRVFVFPRVVIIQTPMTIRDFDFKTPADGPQYPYQPTQGMLSADGRLTRQSPVDLVGRFVDELPIAYLLEYTSVCIVYYYCYFLFFIT